MCDSESLSERGAGLLTHAVHGYLTSAYSHAHRAVQIVLLGHGPDYTALELTTACGIRTEHFKAAAAITPRCPDCWVE